MARTARGTLEAVLLLAAGERVVRFRCRGKCNAFQIACTARALAAHADRAAFGVGEGAHGDSDGACRGGRGRALRGQRQVRRDALRGTCHGESFICRWCEGEGFAVTASLAPPSDVRLTVQVDCAARSFAARAHADGDWATALVANWWQRTRTLTARLAMGTVRVTHLNLTEGGGSKTSGGGGGGGCKAEGGCKGSDEG